MLGHGYLKVSIKEEGVESYYTFPNPVTLSEEYNNIENTALSEGGTDLVNVTRLQKRTWTTSMQVSDYWLGIIKKCAMQSENKIQFKGETVKVRTRIASAALAQYSEYSSESNGYYTVAVSFIEI